MAVKAPRAPWATEGDITGWAEEDVASFRDAFDAEMLRLAAHDDAQTDREQVGAPSPRPDEQVDPWVQRIIGQWEMLSQENGLVVYTITRGPGGGPRGGGAVATRRNIGRSLQSAAAAGPEEVRIRRAPGGEIVWGKDVLRLESVVDPIAEEAGQTPPSQGGRLQSLRTLVWRRTIDARSFELVRRELFGGEALAASRATEPRASVDAGKPDVQPRGFAGDAPASNAGRLSSQERRRALLEVAKYIADDFYSQEWVDQTPRMFKKPTSSALVQPVQNADPLAVVIQLMAFEEGAMWKEREPGPDLLAFSREHAIDDTTVRYLASMHGLVQKKVMATFSSREGGRPAVDVLNNPSYAVYKHARWCRSKAMDEWARGLRVRMKERMFAPAATSVEDALLSRLGLSAAALGTGESAASPPRWSEFRRIVIDAVAAKKDQAKSRPPAVAHIAPESA